jgi:hypothetical protein
MRSSAIAGNAILDNAPMPSINHRWQCDPRQCSNAINQPSLAMSDLSAVWVL